jgi:hypothetical protein
VERHPAGGARFAARSTGGFAVRADVALDADADLERRVRDAVDGLRVAIACSNEQRAHGPVARAADEDGTLGASCRATGWTIRERGPGTVAVDLEVPGAVHQALVERRRDGRVSASVRILDPGEEDAAMSAVCRQALGVLLVRVSGAVRMVRAAADGDGDTAPRIEVVIERADRARAGSCLRRAVGGVPARRARSGRAPARRDDGPRVPGPVRRRRRTLRRVNERDHTRRETEWNQRRR